MSTQYKIQRNRPVVEDDGVSLSRDLSDGQGSSDNGEEGLEERHAELVSR